MKKLDIKKIQTNLYDVIEGTYVVTVSIDDKKFEVNCQTGMTHDYKETYSLTCVNESGGDIGDSGLTQYLFDEYGIDDYGDQFNSICSLIESCAEDARPENTIERLLFDKEDKEYKHEKGLFGAFGPTDVHHEKYIAEDGEIIVTSEDTSEILAEKQLIGYKRFIDEEGYEKWMDEIYDGGHYGDCSVSYRACKDITGNE